MVGTTASAEKAVEGSLLRGQLADVGFTLFRVAFGAFFFYHGIWHFQKGMVWFTGLMHFVHMPAPSLSAHVVAIFEVISGPCIIVGALTRLWSVFGIAMMLVTAFDVKIAQLHTGFLGQTGAGGAETDLLYLLCFLVLLSIGAGYYSVDRPLQTDARARALLSRR